MADDHNDTLTIACISIVGGEALLNCILSVLRFDFDCIVVADQENVSDDVVELVDKQNLEIIYTENCSVPEKRAIAVERTKTDWIALIEDTCAIDEEWRRGFEEITACKHVKAASGPVNLAHTLSARSRALYSADYGKFFPSVLKRLNAQGSGMFRSEALSGVNLLYMRETVMQYISDHNLIESEVNPRMINDGHNLYIHEALSVTLERVDEKGARIHSRFTHGRLYGGLQSENMSPIKRIIRAMSCAILPFILSYRALRAIGYDRHQIFSTAIFIIIFETSWSCGECTGYLLGRGRSLERWN